MRVADLMKTDIVSVDADAPLDHAVALMADAHVSALPVVDGFGHMVGVLSSSDVLAAEAEKSGDDPLPIGGGSAQTVRDLMTPRPLTVEADLDVRDAARQMLYAGVHRMFVARDGKVVGVLSTSDIVQAVAQSHV